jgi:hypothetical protein
MWYNLQPVTVLPCTGEGRSERTQEKRPFSLMVDPSDAHPILRIEVSKSNSSLSLAEQIINLELPSVSATFDTCMELRAHHGQCLAELGGSGDVPLRSNHTLQFECLVNEDDSINRCAEWRECLSGSDGLDTLKNILEAFSMTPNVNGLLQAADETALSHNGQWSESESESESDNGQESNFTSGCTCIDDPNHQTCVDPETMDVEAFDCHCWRDLVKMNGTEINKGACGRADICCDWKASHCATTCTPVNSTTLLEARRTLLSPRTSSVSNKSMQPPLDEPGSLEESAVGKTCTD